MFYKQMQWKKARVLRVYCSPSAAASPSSAVLDLQVCFENLQEDNQNWVQLHVWSLLRGEWLISMLRGVLRPQLYVLKTEWLHSRAWRRACYRVVIFKVSRGIFVQSPSPRRTLISILPSSERGRIFFLVFYRRAFSLFCPQARVSNIFSVQCKSVENSFVWVLLQVCHKRLCCCIIVKILNVIFI